MYESAIHNAAMLHQAGKLADAARLYQEVLRAQPDHFDAKSGLAAILFQTGDFERCQALLGEALTPLAKWPAIFHMRGIALIYLKRHEECLRAFEQAIALRPNYTEALNDRAAALLEMNRPEEALAAFDALVVQIPNDAIAWNNRGNALGTLARYEEAMACFEKALRLDPALTGAEDNRKRALFELKRADRMPDMLVRELFDNFSAHYDSKMLERLEYQAHLHLRALAERVLSGARALHALELGCGTGLAGAAFKDLTIGGRLDGVDLSSRMVDAARARGIYDDLTVADIEEVLGAAGPDYNLIFAADTMNYFGDLTHLLSATWRRLNQGGYFLFTVEEKDGKGWEFTSAKRFRHSENYVREEAMRAGFATAAIEACKLRTDHDQPVAGLAVALTKSA